MSDFCFECRQLVTTETIDTIDNYMIGTTLVSIPIKKKICTKCKNEIFCVDYDKEAKEKLKQEADEKGLTCKGYDFKTNTEKFINRESKDLSRLSRELGVNLDLEKEGRI